MIAVMIDGSACTDLYTDERGRSWHMIQREGGSISFYHTIPRVDIHFVMYDTLDNEPPSVAVQVELEKLTRLRAAIDALLALPHRMGSRERLRSEDNGDVSRVAFRHRSRCDCVVSGDRR